ncbi:hypothetical protein [Qipengyuania gelatinilytica]|uniref:Chain length determinant protein EpsF n=1 Tax=Qipengyuania gelatinilytica TaxID=2867231 RepID=A0ABX9A1C7_9SPHN|nr:hypothetical protein [Qipengyuania gelatinilytica]QZD95081.1 hypothetical protein K3136_13590 [Qipengyuania gelatinilytica]
MSIRQILTRIWRFKVLIVISAIICGGSAYAIASFLPNQYLGKAGVQFNNVVYATAGSYSISNKQIDTYVQTEAELARDFRVTGRVVDRLGWTGSYQLAQRYNEVGAQTGLDFRSWLARGVRDSISLQFEEGSPTFQIGYAGFTPQEARYMAGLIRDEFLAYRRDRSRLEAEENAGRIDERIAELRSRMERVEERNAEFARANDIVINEDGEAMSEIRLRLAAASSEPAHQGSTVVADVPRAQQNQLREVESELARLSVDLGPNHPRIRELTEQRDELRSAAASAASIPQMPTGPSNAAIMQIRSQEVMAKAGAIAQAKRYHDELDVLRDQFAELTEMRENFDLDSQSLQADAISTGEATSRDGVYFPNRRLAVAVGAGFGALLAALLGLFLSLLQLKATSTRDLDLLGVDVLGTRTPTAMAS